MLTTTHSPQKFSGLSQSRMKKEGQPCTANIILLKCPLDLPVSNFPSKSPLLFYGLYSLPRQLSPCSYIIQPSSSLCLYIFTGGGEQKREECIMGTQNFFMSFKSINVCFLRSNWKSIKCLFKQDGFTVKQPFLPHTGLFLFPLSSPSSHTVIRIYKTAWF